MTLIERELESRGREEDSEPVIQTVRSSREQPESRNLEPMSQEKAARTESEDEVKRSSLIAKEEERSTQLG